MTRYELPQNWLNYDFRPVVGLLTEAKAAMLSLINIPYQRSWVEALQAIQLKREIAGTSRIEGADFTDRELDLALSEDPDQLLTRSQRQAHAAMKAYKWITGLPKDRPVDCQLIKEVHGLVVRGADCDHCPPGVLRKRGENVTFGVPPHRGCEGGEECELAFDSLCEALRREFTGHDLLIQALALHFHFAAMHPFLDGNGRTARAVEALMLQRAGLTDHLFIAMSNYYYDEKTAYLCALSEVKPPHYDLTPFIAFGLKGIKLQCERLFLEIKTHLSKAIFRDTMYDLFGRLKSGRKAVLARRHIKILNLLLTRPCMNQFEFWPAIAPFYSSLKASQKAAVRDVVYLLNLKAVSLKQFDNLNWEFRINLDWPQEITSNGFMENMKKLPKAKSFPFCSEQAAALMPTWVCHCQRFQAPARFTSATAAL
jgi:Fic family protein